MKQLILWIAYIFYLTPLSSYAAACFPISSAQMVFGSYNPSSDQPLEIDTTIEFYCSPAFRGRSLTATVQLQNTNNEFTQSILNTSGNDKLEVVIYVDSDRLQPADKDTYIPIRDNNPDTKTFRVTLYGRIPQNQKQISAGQYFGKVTLVLKY
jgi:spore coat protein U-like protein